MGDVLGARAWARRRRAAIVLGKGLVWIVALLVTIWTIAHVSACAGQGRQEVIAADTMAQVANEGGAELAAWSVSRAPCDGLDDATCLHLAKTQDVAVWATWDAYAAAWEVYAEAIERGEQPPMESVLRALCALVAVLPQDGPPSIVANAARCGGAP